MTWSYCFVAIIMQEQKTNLRLTLDKFDCNNDLYFIKIKSTTLIGLF